MIVDVSASEHLDRVVACPRRCADAVDLLLTLCDTFPSLAAKRTAEGIVIPIGQAHHLLDSEIVEFRWSEEARVAAENRRRAIRGFDTALRALRDLRKRGSAAAIPLITGLRNPSLLDDHQIVGVAAMTLSGSPGLCLFDEQGAGKTVTTLHAFDMLATRGEADFALIIAPKSMIAEWPHDFQRFMGDLYNVAVAAGSRAQKLSALRQGADVVVTNFETAVALEHELRSALRRYGERAVLIVDESFYAKSLDAHRTRALRRLREWCGRAFVLCGTPAPNAPHDVVQQVNLADFGLAFNGIVVPDDRDEAKEVVQRVIETRCLYVRHVKSQVLPELPAKRFSRLFVPLAAVQGRVYRAAVQELLLDLRSTTDAEFSRRITSFLARRAALLQICSNPRGVTPGYVECPAKLSALDSLLDDLVMRRKEKVVVWSFYTASLTAIYDRYERHGAVRYDGTVTDPATRREAVRRFQEDDATMLFVGNPAAAGAGLTLHRARFAIYESLSPQCAHYLQSLDRIHRRGQSRQVEYVVLLCDGTIEVGEYERLVQKERAAQDLLGDPPQVQWTRELMIEEAKRASTTFSTAARTEA